MSNTHDLGQNNSKQTTTIDLACLLSIYDHYHWFVFNKISHNSQYWITPMLMITPTNITTYCYTQTIHARMHRKHNFTKLDLWLKLLKEYNYNKKNYVSFGSLEPMQNTHTHALLTYSPTSTYYKIINILFYKPWVVKLQLSKDM